MWTIQNRKLIRGAKEHIAARLGAGADYVADYVDIASPIDGIVEKRYTGNEGGHWLWIKDKKGRSWQFAHLSKYYCYENTQIGQGKIIAVSGNTGTITTNPHIHIQVIDKNGNRLDPEIIIKELLQPIMNYENKIIRNQKSGEFAYIQEGKRRTITAERAGFAMITVWTKGWTPKDNYQSLTDEEFNKVPKGKDF